MRQARCADLQDVARVDRQQGGGAGKEHGEQVERDRAEDHLVAHDIAQPVHDLRRSAAGPCGWAAAGPCRSGQRADARRRTGRQRPHRAGQARSRRDSRRSPGRRSCRPARRSRTARWRWAGSRGTRFGASADRAGPAKRARNAEHDGDAEQQRQSRSSPLQVSAASMRRIASCSAMVIRATHPAVEPVGGEARERGQQEQRHELQQADQRKLARRFGHVHPAVARDVIGLPPDDQQHRILRQRHRQARSPVSAEIGDAERMDRRDRSRRRHGRPRTLPSQAVT